MGQKTFAQYLIDGEPDSIAWEKVGEKQFLVTKEGRTIRFELTDRYVLCDHQTYPYRLIKGSSGTDILYLDGHKFEIEVKRSSQQGVAKGEGQIVAPMNGATIEVLVCAGDKVEENQILVILEAMKMQNEIRSTCKGSVENVDVQVGDIVQSGQLLLSIKGDTDEPS